MSDRDGTEDHPAIPPTADPGAQPGVQTGDDPAAWSGDGSTEDPFTEGDRTDLEAQVVTPEDDSDDLEAIVPTSTYCQRCEHFATPPAVACDHPGTALLEVVDVDHFMVRDCPVVEQRLGEVDRWEASGVETDGDGGADPDSDATSGVDPDAPPASRTDASSAEREEN